MILRHVVGHVVGVCMGCGVAVGSVSSSISTDNYLSPQTDNSLVSLESVSMKETRSVFFQVPFACEINHHFHTVVETDQAVSLGGREHVRRDSKGG